MCREMKDSGVQWIGHIPREWNITKLKNLIIESNSGEVIDRSYWDLGDEILYSCSKETILSNYSNFPDEKRTVEGDLLLTRNATPYVFIPIQNSIYTNVVQRIKLKNNVNIKFVKYNLETSALSIKGFGDIIESFNMNVWGNSFCVLPNIIEQEVIVNYLDKKVSQIDDIISKQKILIEKYKAYKQSLITETVTKGLNKNVPMKDSGIEWIGEIPSDWSVTITKNISNKITDGAHVSPETENGVYDFISVVNLDNNFINFNGCLKTSEASYIQMVKNGCKPKKGDVLISKDGTVGKSVVIDYDREFVIASSLVILTPNEKMNSYFLNYVIQSSCIQEQLNSFMKGSGLKRVSVKNNGKLYVTVPSISEQEDIVNFLDKKCSAIDSAIAKKEQLIEKLESYKKSLIYECVTGKREVN